MCLLSPQMARPKGSREDSSSSRVCFLRVSTGSYGLLLQEGVQRFQAISEVQLSGSNRVPAACLLGGPRQVRHPLRPQGTVCKIKE